MRNKNNTPQLTGYTRVSDVLSPFTDFSHIDKNVLLNAANRGTRVHKYIELHLHNLFVADIDEDCQPYFESFLQWQADILDKVYCLEDRYYCDDYKITGQVDMIGTFKGSDEQIIIDIKTPQSQSKTWRLQTAAYLYLARKNVDPSIKRRGCLMLDKLGAPANFVEYTSKLDEDLFFKALELKRFFT